jgi:SAM-dependent MidA family methyltransferase
VLLRPRADDRPARPGADVTPIEAIVRERIARDGPLSFREVMRLALYHPEHGYYSNLRGVGAEGDFVTSPELHPGFGYLLARQVADVWEALGRPRPLRVLELGGGSGALAAALLSAPRADEIDLEYAIDEPSESLREVQRQRLEAVEWKADGIYHVVIANEVLDAQPVHRVTVRNGQLRELLVAIGSSDELTWIEADAVPPEVNAYFTRLGLKPAEGSVAEVNVDVSEWVGSIAQRIERGMALVLDYGYPAEALFSRPQGTLLTYWRHTLGSDPLVRLGMQDISIHVDFSSVATAAQASGFRVAGVTSQRALLRNLGIDAIDDAARGPTDRHAIARLTDPNGLGRIGALFLTRGLDEYAPVGLTGGREWPAPMNVPSLPSDSEDAEFLDQWREAFSA